MDLTLNPRAIPDKPFALAFSGGGDSTALVHALRGRKPYVFIVDHGLRAGSAAEAKTAKAFANSLGLTCDILTWQPPEITAGLQAKARNARYSLLGDACRAHGLSALMTGHTEDDQAETVLMRLKAGGSWRGGAGMRAVTPSPIWPALAGIDICRPMLGVGRAAVRNYLVHHRLPYVDDPSNENTDFARIRARKELAASPKLRHDMLALSGDMQAAREGERKRLLAEMQTVSIDDLGCIHLRGVISPALLALLIKAASGTSTTQDAAAVMRLRTRLQSSDFTSATLGGALISKGEGVTLSRDPVIALGRNGQTPIKPQHFDAPGLWDGRFWIEGGYDVVPAAGHLSKLPKALAAAIKKCHANARLTLPYVTQDGALVAVGPFAPDGTPSSVVKSALLPRLTGELTAPWGKAN